ncbi:MAG: carboxypeptidase-like regulatory domain-containing protein, partial [Bacteroidales bacterium]|nr:carboxypeptidase-like regulatory domain-containing protein [Bacteroidales bacterium]
MKLPVIILTFLCGNVFSQTCTITGRLTNKAGQPVSYAQVIAYSETQPQTPEKFTTTSDGGRFELSLRCNAAYSIAVRHLSYTDTTVHCTAAKGIKIELTLAEKNRTMEEVVVSSNMPIRYRNDTLEFTASFFKSG